MFHFPDLDSECLGPMSLTTTGIRASGGAYDVKATQGGALPTPVLRSPRLNTNMAYRRGHAPALVPRSTYVHSRHHQETKVQKLFIVDQ